MNTKHRDIISKFFNELEQKTKYAILHHANKVFDQDDDIDFIANCNKDHIINFVKDFVRKNNLYCINHFTIDINTYRFDLLYYYNSSLKKIELDCTYNSHGNDLLCIDTFALLEERVLVEVNSIKFYKISHKNEIEFYIKKKIHKGDNPLDYSEYFRSLDKDFNEKLILDIVKKWSIYFSSISYKIKYFKNKLLLLVNRLYEKPALTICFLGPDGSGKSTVINEITKLHLFINTYYFHLKPFFGNGANPVIVENPHSQKEYSFIKSYIKLLFFIYQYNMGWLKNIIKLKIKSSLIIFDRYYDDLLVDRKRYRYGGSKVIAKLVKFFIPRPDLYFILTADPKIIYKRKQEVEFDELKRQVSQYKKLCDNKRYFCINVDRPPDEICREIIAIIMEKMNERY